MSDTKAGTKFKALSLRHDMMEFINFIDSTFPLEIYDDRFSEFYDQKLPCHWHDVVEIDLLLKGKATYLVNGQEVPLSEGEVLLIMPGMMHQAGADTSDALVIGLTFDPELIAGSASSLMYRKFFLPMIKKFSYLRINNRKLNSLVEEIYNNRKDAPFYEYRCFEYLTEIWGCILTSPETTIQSKVTEQSLKQSKEVKKMLDYITQHFYENIHIANLCDCANISRSECFRLFERYSLFSPMEYLNNYRLSIAATYLSDHSLNVTEVAKLCGFDSPSYFSKQFKKHYGLTPSSYRRKNCCF